MRPANARLLILRVHCSQTNRRRRGRGGGAAHVPRFYFRASDRPPVVPSRWRLQRRCRDRSGSVRDHSGGSAGLRASRSAQ